ncbi:hypothetical protein EVAR_49505_1 [Eumeta japonica]|uniref:Uncharacterized protein n=1 Tax=Eumeta variegata TaxID=151549 RepID=A0A4C1VYV6_EUMVA|nr:hypothetical protein EVAR_49505_1 [Eumeta japonica]
MTVKKGTRCGGHAALVARQRLHNADQQVDMLALTKPTPHQYNIVVGFNEKDQLQLDTYDDSKIIESEDKIKLLKDFAEPKPTKQENIPIDDIANCVNVETYPNCGNTLVFYVIKSLTKEAIALKFENEQDFKRIYFTYKYFKMRNRLTKNNANNHSSSVNLFHRKKSHNTRKNSVDDQTEKPLRVDFDLQANDDGLTYISLQQKYPHSRSEQPMSLIGIRSDAADLGEIDSIIYTDVDIPVKPDRKRLFQRIKPKAPQPPTAKDNNLKVLKGEFVRVNVERTPDVIPKENKHNKIPDILVFKEKNRSKTTQASNLWTVSNKITRYTSGPSGTIDNYRYCRWCRPVSPLR